eukprot:2523677-Rhodomonas_salina.1
MSDSVVTFASIYGDIASVCGYDPDVNGGYDQSCYQSARERSGTAQVPPSSLPNQTQIEQRQEEKCRIRPRNAVFSLFRVDITMCFVLRHFASASELCPPPPAKKQQKKTGKPASGYEVGEYRTDPMLGAYYAVFDRPVHADGSVVGRLPLFEDSSVPVDGGMSVSLWFKSHVYEH